MLSFWWENLPDLLRGLVVSLKLFVVSTVGGLTGGFALSLLCMHRSRAVRGAFIMIVEIGRGIPSLVMLQLFYYGLPSAGIRLEAMPAAWLALASTTAAYSAEILRGGYEAVPDSQRAAGRALGLAPMQVFWHVVLPQGLRTAVAPVVGFCLQMFQATSLAFALSIPELLSRAYEVGNLSYRYLAILSLAGIIYAFVGLPMLSLTRLLERRVDGDGHGGARRRSGGPAGASPQASAAAATRVQPGGNAARVRQPGRRWTRR